jgi:hypothetical protein
MLTKNEIHNVIRDRLDAISGSCNSGHLDHNAGVFRGLIWVLIGKDPGTYLTHDIAKMLTLAGVAFEQVGDTIHYRLESSASAPREG